MFYKKIKLVSSPEHYVCEPLNVAWSQIFGQIQYLWPLFLKEGVQKRARRDGCSCRNDTIGNALERWGLGASFGGYYTFVGALYVALSEVKEHAQP